MLSTIITIYLLIGFAFSLLVLYVMTIGKENYLTQIQLKNGIEYRERHEDIIENSWFIVLMFALLLWLPTLISMKR